MGYCTPSKTEFPVSVRELENVQISCESGRYLIIVSKLFIFQKIYEKYSFGVFAGKKNKSHMTNHMMKDTWNTINFLYSIFMEISKKKITKKKYFIPRPASPNDHMRHHI